MQYGTAIVEKIIHGKKCSISVRVGVERPSNPAQSYIRRANALPSSGAVIGALSGARFARHKVDICYFGIEVVDISGDVNNPEAFTGSAIASAVATWVGYGIDWRDADLGEMDGWVIGQTAGT